MEWLIQPVAWMLIGIAVSEAIALAVRQTSWWRRRAKIRLDRERTERVLESMYFGTRR